MGSFRFAKKLVASAAAMAILMAVPAAAAPSFAVFAEEEAQETEASKPKETVKETKQAKETKASSKVAETTKATETQKPAETKSAETKPAETKASETKPAETKPSETTKATEASKPSETVRETEASKPSETQKETEPAETSKATEPSETKPSEPSESTEPVETTEPEETKSSEPSETAEPSETTDGTEETTPSESVITEETQQKPVTAKKKAASGEYKGIDIDGNFSDWDSVIKHDFTVGANSNVNEAAMVWDGEWIYLYIDEVQQNSATWSGPERYGNFAITTDTGKTLVVHLQNNNEKGNIVKVENKYTNTELTSENGGIKVAFNKGYSTWGEPTLTEIAIPTSALPDYKSKISFGFYQDKQIIKNVANLHPEQVPDDPDDPHTENDGSKIKIDGNYRDWTDYPHQIIHYDKSGPQHNYADAEGAIYQKSSKIVYVHGYTNDFDPPFAYYDGNQFLEIRLELGGKTTTMMSCLIDENGNIDWDSHRQDRHYAKGTYKFALFETKSWRSATNINDLGPGDILYGYQYLTVGDHVDETEFYIDTEVLAKYLGVSGGELKVTFHRVGKDPLIASGISTGPIFTLALTSVAAGSYYVFARRKRRQA